MSFSAEGLKTAAKNEFSLSSIFLPFIRKSYECESDLADSVATFILCTIMYKFLMIKPEYSRDSDQILSLNRMLDHYRHLFSSYFRDIYVMVDKIMNFMYQLIDRPTFMSNLFGNAVTVADITLVARQWMDISNPLTQATVYGFRQLGILYFVLNKVLCVIFNNVAYYSEKIPYFGEVWAKLKLHISVKSKINKYDALGKLLEIVGFRDMSEYNPRKSYKVNTVVYVKTINPKFPLEYYVCIHRVSTDQDKKFGLLDKKFWALAQYVEESKKWNYLKDKKWHTL